MTDKREASDKRDIYSQMDKAAVRTAADIEQKYNIGKSFAEVAGIAEDARANAATAQKTAESVDSKLDQEEIFRRLTNNFTMQGMKQMGDSYYFSGECIYALEKLFAKDIVMTGTFTHTVKTFVFPGEAELETLRQLFLLYEQIPYYPEYDFNSDGVLDGIDLLICRKAIWGYEDAIEILSNWEGKVETDVTLTIDLKNPEKAICITGKNMWGRDIESYIGVNFTNIKNPETDRKLTKLSEVQRLWSGMFFMNDTQRATLNEGVSKQKTGIVLKWEVFNPDTQEVMDGEGTHYTFVPKIDVPNAEVTTGLMISKSATILGKKTVFVHENTVEGYADNSAAQSSLGITLNNHRWVLTEVYGV